MPSRRIGFWYRLAAMIVKPPLIALFKRDWRGMENIPTDSGFLTAVNHNSHLDPFAYAHFQYNTGRVPRFLAKAGLFTPFIVGAFMRGTGQIPVFRATADAAAAFRAAVEAVDRGECVVFYPEGTLTRDPEMWPMVSKTGVARVALLTKAPVVPIAQWGANELLPPYAKKPKFFPRKTHRVLAGPPVDLSAFYGKDPTAEVLREATAVIMEAVKDLLAEVRGEPAPAGLWDQRKGRRVGIDGAPIGAAQPESQPKSQSKSTSTSTSTSKSERDFEPEPESAAESAAEAAAEGGSSAKDAAAKDAAAKDAAVKDAAVKDPAGGEEGGA